MTLTATRPAASIGELRRAWQAIERGDFRTGHHAPDPPRSEVDGADDAAEPAGPVWQPPGLGVPTRADPPCRSRGFG